MTQYDVLADKWNSTVKDLIWTKLNIPNHQNLFDEIQGKKALDLACGEGLFARYLLSKGASKVVGVDISEAQIQSAKNKDPMGSIEWVVGDATQLEKLGDFDIISACFLLNYAKDAQELLAMCISIKRNLGENGKFYGTVPQPPKNKEALKKYGLHFQYEDVYGAPVTLGFVGTVQIQFYFHSPETFERAFKTAGFSHFEWREYHVYNISPEEVEFYKDLEENRLTIGIVAW